MCHYLVRAGLEVSLRDCMQTPLPSSQKTKSKTKKQIPQTFQNGRDTWDNENPTQTILLHLIYPKLEGPHQDTIWYVNSNDYQYLEA